VPVVSAVGHEIDVTLTDLVADVRAATPSQAAELLVPDHEAQRQTLQRFQRHLVRAQISHVAAARACLSRLAARVGDPRFVIVERQQEVDELLERMSRVTRSRLARGRREQRELAQRLAHRHPERVLGRARGQLAQLSGRMAAAMREQLSSRREAFGSCAAQLDALSPLAVLARGYAIATRDGIAILSSQELAPGDIVKVRVAHGGFRAKVTQVEAPAHDEQLEPAPVSEVRS
jgi:exodeoxyribonuclease VII large subunit